jgi:hypothetical protein
MSFVGPSGGTGGSNFFDPEDDFRLAKRSSGQSKTCCGHAIDSRQDVHSLVHPLKQRIAGTNTSISLNVPATPTVNVSANLPSRPHSRPRHVKLLTTFVVVYSWSSTVSARTWGAEQAAMIENTASAVLSVDLRDICPLPSLVIRTNERRRLKVVRQS